MAEFLWEDGRKFSSFVAEPGSGDNKFRNVVLQSKLFWMVSCSAQILLPGSNNQAFAYSVV